MKFFFDNCLSPHLARAIHALVDAEGDSAIHLRDKFVQNTSDVEWIRTLGSEGEWTIVSGDYMISRKEHERAAWKESGLTAFFLAKGWTNFEIWEQAWRLVRWWPRINEQARLVQPGAGFEVPVTPTSKFRQLEFRKE